MQWCLSNWLAFVLPAGEIQPEDATRADGCQKQGASILKLLGCGLSLCCCWPSALLHIDWNFLYPLIWRLPLLPIRTSSLLSPYSVQPNGWKVSVPFLKSTLSAPKGGAKADGQVRRRVTGESKCFQKAATSLLHSFQVLGQRMAMLEGNQSTHVKNNYSSSGPTKECCSTHCSPPCLCRTPAVPIVPSIPQMLPFNSSLAAFKRLGDISTQMTTTTLRLIVSQFGVPLVLWCLLSDSPNPLSLHPVKRMLKWCHC